MAQYGAIAAVDEEGLDFKDEINRINEDEMPKSCQVSFGQRGRTWAWSLVVGLSFMLIIIALKSDRGGLWKGTVVVPAVNLKSESSVSFPFEGTDPFLFTLHRSGYDPLSYFTENKTSVIKYKLLEDYAGVVEPYASMSLYVQDSASAFAAGHTFRYTICPSTTEEYNATSECTFGEYTESSARHVTVECSPFDTFDITVTEYDGHDFVRNSTSKAMCMYVRREIRTLSSSDLSATMDAMYALWSTSEEDGQALYGENFHASSYFTEAHTFNAAQQDADHIHEGLGFLPQHVKISNMFELAMQSVDPSVSLPYWDFTIDNAEGTTLAESYMFTAETFGSITNPVDSVWGWTYRNDSIEDAAIPDGRWAKIKADANNKYPTLSNSFGYMRGPWNMNPSPYISRFAILTTSLPTCSAYYDWLQYTDLSDFLSHAPFAPHASTHGAIGAVYGCDIMDNLLEEGIIADEDSQRKICKKWGFYLKELYRSNLIAPKPASECTVESMDYDGITCGFDCNEDTSSNVFEAAMKALISSDWVPSTITNKGWDKWVDFVCTGDGYRVFVGDHLESASPSDPSFWPIHPTQERLLQAKFMAGGFDTSTWATDPDDVCDKAKCYEADYGDKDYYDECCYGHNQYDQLLDFVNGDKSSGFGPTNHEILKGTNPSTVDYTMPYIYDNFDYDHCSEDFFELMKTLLYPER